MWNGSGPQGMDEHLIRAARPPKGHKYWGFTIFRCTYGDDEAWLQLLKLIREAVQESAEYYGAPDLIHSFRLTVFEDPSVFVEASTALLRKRFREWRSGRAIEEETDGTDGYPIVMEDVDGIHGTRSRYQFCVQVDEQSLYSSIDRDTKAPTEAKIASNSLIQGHVNLINAEWELPDRQLWAEEREMDPRVEDPLEEDEEPIEGLKLYDAGWMKTSLWVFDVSAQTYLSDEKWRIHYVRPPGMVLKHLMLHV